MLKRYLLMAAVLAVGGVFGWLVASGGLQLSRAATVSTDPPAKAESALPPSDTSSGELGAGPQASALLIAQNQKVSANLQKEGKKPNILIIWGDDVGMWNISAYHRGMMGGSTPNIDRLAKEGMIFMDHYATPRAPPGGPPSSWASTPCGRV